MYRLWHNFIIQAIWQNKNQSYTLNWHHCVTATPTNYVQTSGISTNAFTQTTWKLTTHRNCWTEALSLSPFHDSLPPQPCERGKGEQCWGGLAAEVDTVICSASVSVRWGKRDRNPAMVTSAPRAGNKENAPQRAAGYPTFTCHCRSVGDVTMLTRPCHGTAGYLHPASSLPLRVVCCHSPIYFIFPNVRPSCL